ncbi:MAG TPA: hypothetical protein DD670_01405 [Planctomycetaceae bacterium]|nr:hypothetical protein [Planctomycetaceae bacterium]
MNKETHQNGISNMFLEAIVSSIFQRRAVRRCRVLLATIAGLVIAMAGVMEGQTLLDPGFESYALNSGAFVVPDSGPWSFSNDAGIVEPYSPNSSTGPLNTWSAMFAALEGEQYASTYAGGDTIRQVVSFDTAGDYIISVHAAAPEGSVTIPAVASLSLEDGEFTFTLQNNPIGETHTVVKGSSWSLCSAILTIDSPGDYTLGIQNTKWAPYFINYDALSVQPVPEPTVVVMLLSLGMAVVGVRATRRGTPRRQIGRVDRVLGGSSSS